MLGAVLPQWKVMDSLSGFPHGWEDYCQAMIFLIQYSRRQVGIYLLGLVKKQTSSIVVLVPMGNYL